MILRFSMRFEIFTLERERVNWLRTYTPRERKKLHDGAMKKIYDQVSGEYLWRWDENKKTTKWNEKPPIMTMEKKVCGKEKENAWKRFKVTNSELRRDLFYWLVIQLLLLLSATLTDKVVGESMKWRERKKRKEKRK